MICRSFLLTLNVLTMTDPTLALRGATQYLAGQRKPTDVTVDGIGIERLRTRVVDVQPQTNWEKARLRSAKNLNINANAKTGRRDEQIVLSLFFAGSTLN
jgi:hypothetical protein